MTPALSATFRHALTFLTGIHCVPGSDAALIAIEPADPLITNAVCYASDRKGHDQYERGHGQRRKPGTESAGPAAVKGKDRRRLEARWDLYSTGTCTREAVASDTGNHAAQFPAGQGVRACVPFLTPADVQGRRFKVDLLQEDRRLRPPGGRAGRSEAPLSCELAFTQRQSHENSAIYRSVRGCARCIHVGELRRAVFGRDRHDAGKDRRQARSNSCGRTACYRRRHGGTEQSSTDSTLHSWSGGKDGRNTARDRSGNPARYGAGARSRHQW